MTAGPSRDHRAAAVTTGPHPRGARLALGFVLLSLLALVVVPVLVQRRIDALRDQVELVVEPARENVTTIQYFLARQMSALRGYMVAEDSSFLDRYRVLVEEQQAVQRELRPLAERLGPEALRRFGRLEVLSEQWHARGAGDLSALADPDQDPRFQAELYDDLLAAAAAMDEAITAASRDYQAAIRAAERMSLYLTAALVLLALGSALVAAWFGRRVRLLADAAGRALEETRSMTEERSRLLRGITHDVKNPLGAADGYAQLLEAGLEPLSPRQVVWVAGIRRSLRSTLLLIDDLLRLDRAGSADVAIERSLVELRSLLEQTAAEHAGVVESAGHDLEVETPPDPVRVWTDPDRVGQILGNLVTNAIKYTPPPGHIRLSLEVVRAGGASAERAWAVMRVIDDGPGIPADQQERIFEEFQRLDPTGPAGHGLGLAISRRLAQLLRGRITVESEPPGGSVFSLWLPLRAEEDAGGVVESR